MKYIKRFVAVAVLLGFTVFAVISGFIVYGAKSCKPRESDVIIVLGCQIWGTSPSWLLKFRLDKALELYKAGYAGKIIVSGGKGADEVTYESSVMKEWLAMRGVPLDNIYEENRSTSTYENLEFSRRIMEDNNLKTAIIITNDFHVFRSLKTAGKLGIEAAGAPAANLWYLRPYYHCREVLAIIKYFVLQPGVPAGASSGDSTTGNGSVTQSLVSENRPLSHYPLLPAELAILLLLALISDIRTYKVKNIIILPFIASGILTNLYLSGPKGAASSVIACLLPALVLLLLFALRMLGAGDIKLFCAVGAIMGLRFLIYTMAWSFLSGGVIALVLIILRKNARLRFIYLLGYLKTCFLTFSLHPYTDFEDKKDGAKFRFTYAIACGAVIQTVIMYLVA